LSQAGVTGCAERRAAYRAQSGDAVALPWVLEGHDSGFDQNLGLLLTYKIADPDGSNIPCEQLDGMRPRTIFRRSR
jgi:hypothetical protein